jgi:hypothetical protein
MMAAALRKAEPARAVGASNPSDWAPGMTAALRKTRPDEPITATTEPQSRFPPPPPLGVGGDGGAGEIP